MTRLTTIETDAMWAGIDDQRARTASLLEGLTPEQWEHPSLCDGWTVPRSLGANPLLTI